MNAPIEPRPELWRQHLASLPDVDPPDALWAKLQSHVVAPERARPVWPWAAAAAAAVLAAVLVWSRPEAPVAPTLATAPTAPAAPVVDQNVRLLDQELSLAYAREADEAELAGLWQTRERLLQDAGQAEQPLLVRL